MTKAAELAKMGEVITNSQIGGRRNIVINGAMQVAQRATSATGVGSAGGYFTLDRFRINTGASAGRATMTQTADGPSGFANCLKLDCTTADTSIAAGENLIITHRIEGQDLQQIKKGTSDAEKVTISFYVKGNASATYMLEVKDSDNTRLNHNQFAVTTDWTRIVITLNADTTGAFDDDNALSLELSFWLHAGSTFTSGTYTPNTWAGQTNANRAVGITSFFDSTDRTFFLTGLQMEVGSQATPFEHRSFGEELALCQRYFQKYADDGNGNGYFTNGMITGTRLYGVIRWTTTMRANPTVAGTSGDFNIQSSAHTGGGFSIDETHNPSVDAVRLRTGSNSNLTNGQGAILRFDAAGSLTADSEL